MFGLKQRKKLIQNHIAYSEAIFSDDFIYLLYLFIQYLIMLKSCHLKLYIGVYFCL